MPPTTPVSSALLLDLHTTHGREDEIDRRLGAGVGEAPLHPETSWFVVQFHRNRYGVFATAPTTEQIGLVTPLTDELDEADLLVESPELYDLEVLATKLPDAPVAKVDKGLLVTLAAKQGKFDEVEQFLLDARPIVADEPGTLAWFAFRMAPNRFGIFDVFADSGDRFAHLSGPVGRALAAHTLELLSDFPDITFLDVLGCSLTS